MTFARLPLPCRGASPQSPRPPRGGRRRALLGVTYALLLVSCDSPFAPDESTVARLEATPLTLTMTAGETRPVSVRVLDDGGATLANRRLFWSSQDPQVATVSQSGIVSGVAPGATQVAASAGGKSIVIPVTVSARPVSLVRVTPASTAIIEGTSTALTAQALDAAGATVAGRPVLWATSDAAIATVTSTGVVSAVAPGTVTVSATIDGVVGTAIVTVQPVPVASLSLTPPTASLIVGDFVQLTATPRDASGAALSGRSIAWSSSAQSLVSVSSTGLVTALAVGTATITATSEGKSATARITASLVPVESITLSPASATIAAGRTVQLVARAVDSAGTPLTGRTITWTTDQPSIATVDNAGLVTGITAGRATITASVDGKSAAAAIDVTPVPVASLTITPGSGTLLVGSTLQLTATARDASGSALPGRSITWISGAPSVATVTQGGLVTAVGSGSALVFAAAEGVSASVTITVSGIGVAQVRVTPATTNVQQGRTVQLSAVAYDASGNPLTGRTILWNSGAPTIASVSSSGLVTGIALGTATVTATVDGVVGSAVVTVSSVPIASVSVSPANASLNVGGALVLVATAYDAAGALLPGRPLAFVSDASSIATVGSTGLVTGIAPGTARIIVTPQGQPTPADTAVITVTLVPVDRLVLTPDAISTSIGTGPRTYFSAILYDSAGNPLSAVGRSIAWSSLDTAIATVDASTGVVSTVSVNVTPARIVAATAGATGMVADTAYLTVTNVPVAYVEIQEGAAATVHLGAPYARTLTAKAYDAGGIPLTRAFTWSSLDPVIAQVDSSVGVVTGQRQGTARVIAGSGGAADTITVTVDLVPISPITTTVAPGAAQADSVLPGPANVRAYTATPRDSAGNVIAEPALGGRLPAWSISPAPGPATLTSSGATASVTPNSPGTVTVRADYGGGVAPTATLRILVPVSRIAMTASPDSLFVGGNAALFVSANDAGGNPIVGRSIQLSSASIPSVIALGTTSGVQSLSTTITGVSAPGGRASATSTASATLDGVSNATTVHVLAPVSSIVVTSAADSIYVGGSVQATATLLDAAGDTLRGRPVTWSTGDTTITTIAPTGIATGIKAGNTTIIASAEGRSGSRVLLVQERVSTVELTAASSSIAAGQTQPTTVTLKDRFGIVITGTRVVSYGSSDTAVARVDATGIITAVNPGTANITATSEGKVSPPLPITVTPAAVASVTVSASPYPNLYPGQPPFPAAVQGYDASGNPLNLSGRTIVWSSADASIASVTAGLPGSATIAPLKVGTTTVTASVDGVQATTPVTVVISAVPVDRVTVSPASATAQTGATVQFGATALDSTGATLAGVTFTWSTSNAKATVDSAGLASAVDSGSVNVIATAATQGSGGSSPAGSGTLVISLAPIGSVTLTPTSLTLPSRNAAGTLTVDVRSATNVALQGRTCTVLSANTGVFIVTSAATAITDANGKIAVGIKGAGLGSAALDVTCDPTSPTPAAATATITVP